MDGQTWKNGLHDLHCREDRCSLGCDCPCHQGEDMSSLPRAEISFSWRYGVTGWYLDRGLGVLRLYPVPFVRLSIVLGRGK